MSGAWGRTGGFGEKENTGPALQGPAAVPGRTGLELNAAGQCDLKQQKAFSVIEGRPRGLEWGCFCAVSSLLDPIGTCQKQPGTCQTRKYENCWEPSASRCHRDSEMSIAS